MPTTCQPPDTATSEERVYVRNVHAPHAVRRFARAILGKWSLDHLIENTETVASELATNAAQNASGDTIAVRIERSASAICIKVWDDNAELPTGSNPGINDERGRGLMITAALSERWGCYRVAGAGKVVWAIIGPECGDAGQ